MSRNAKQVWVSLVLAGAVGCLGADLVGLLGRWLPGADAANQLLPWWSITGFLFLGTLMALGDRRLRFGSFIAVIWLATTTLPVLLREVGSQGFEEQPMEGHALRVIQFNMSKDNVAPQITANWILAQKANVLILEETLGRSEGAADILRKKYPYEVSCHGKGRCSTIILSAVPFVASAGYARGDAENRHALSAASATFNYAGKNFTVIALHLTRPWPFDDQTRSLRQLTGVIQRFPRDTLIVAGDFNMTPWTYAAQRQDRLVDLPRLSHGIMTWPARIPGSAGVPVPILAIDQIYAGKDLHLVSLVRGPRLGSDHYPIVAEFALRR